MIKATFYLPLHDNDGRDLSHEINAVEQRVFDTFHAITDAGVVLGAYLMTDGTRADDELQRYELILDENRLDDLKAALRAFKSSTTQEAIYLEVLYNVDADFV